MGVFEIFLISEPQTHPPSNFVLSRPLRVAVVGSGGRNKGNILLGEGGIGEFQSDQVRSEPTTHIRAALEFVDEDFVDVADNVAPRLRRLRSNLGGGFALVPQEPSHRINVGGSLFSRLEVCVREAQPEEGR